MADMFDQAQEGNLGDNDAAWKAHQAKAAATVRPQATGECLDPLCGEPLGDVRDHEGNLTTPLYCGPKCAQAHARRMK